tara:strand:+ start:97 stop:645 length:549 start_codon:yes stop_codon:yes gene_type:complete
LTPWITHPVPFNIGQGVAAAADAGSCIKQLLTGQTAALSPDQDIGQQFTSDAWFDLSKITKAQFSIKRAASVDSSLTITCKLLDSDATTVLGTLGDAVNVSSEVTESFSFITFEGSGLPDPTEANDILILILGGSGWNADDVTIQWSDGSGGAITGTNGFSISNGTAAPHVNRNSVIKINCD